MGLGRFAKGHCGNRPRMSIFNRILTEAYTIAWDQHPVKERVHAWSPT